MEVRVRPRGARQESGRCPEAQTRWHGWPAELEGGHEAEEENPARPPRQLRVESGQPETDQVLAAASAAQGPAQEARVEGQVARLERRPGLGSSPTETIDDSEGGARRERASLQGPQWPK